jgi:hypothetical protein
MVEPAINQAGIDRFTAGHAAIGALLGAAGVRAELAAITAIGWELAESPLKARFPQIFPHASPDSAQNALLDVGAWMLGYMIGRALQNSGR